ncbi:NADH-quinone oxidoreductase subunit J [Conexibacter sp. CPCC 206217]|uniref:NADH-quinone oxidoreductase subunit J family protein n=1 Tax=Conexibacter sp. CPCC 206217 TaxID=3064574 RepID=UPI002722DAF5|nr:NADH-quinone oxidoreductase subunit J [Conexibacter sp. CPCC 206217]MDO8211949.1 NADH-quinone oxidoreductase subunit J [Conexibacter sp. CPCC 206217]
MSAVIFFIAAIGALAGAIGVVALRNPFYSVLALVGHLISLSALFLLLRAEFLAAAQVIVYAGAVTVLYVFVVSYVGDGTVPFGPGGLRLRNVSAMFVGVLFVELAIAILGSGLKAIDGKGAPYVPGFGTPESIGEALLTKFLLPFELASLLLLVAAVGAVMLARRRSGGVTLDDEPYDAARYITPRSLFSGTMAEAVGALHAPPEPPRVAPRPAPEREPVPAAPDPVNASSPDITADDASRGTRNPKDED